MSIVLPVTYFPAVVVAVVAVVVLSGLAFVRRHSFERTIQNVAAS